jgi:1-acyl-sn-glycerol-3-phosphate acyltransferase
MRQFYTSDQTGQQLPAITKAQPQVAHNISRVSPWLSPVAYFLGRHFLLPLFFSKIEITGQENIPTTGPVILAPTHRSRWDALLIPYAVNACVTAKDLRFMVTISECEGIQGWFVRHLGGFPVDQKRPSITTLRHGVALLQQRKTLVIFPEGGIFRDGKVNPLKPGIARLSLSAESSQPGLGVKIIPISINYSHPYPQWGADVRIHIGSAINVSDYTSSHVKQNAQLLTSDLALALKKLSHQESEVNSQNILDFGLTNNQ